MYRNVISSLKFMFQTTIHEIVYPVVYAFILFIIQVFIIAFLLFDTNLCFSETHIRFAETKFFNSESSSADKNANSFLTKNIFKKDSIKSEKLKNNYIGFTPTFVFMGMYGLVYAHALDEKHILTGVGGYTNFDLSPIPFLHNDKWVYQNIYLGLNYTIFPFSDRIFPRGFYYGIDFVPSFGFWKKRETGKQGRALGLSADILMGYSWILNHNIKLSTDLFLNANPPGIKLSGEQPGDGKWVILPFFDFNVGIVF